MYHDDRFRENAVNFFAESASRAFTPGRHPSLHLSDEDPFDVLHKSHSPRPITRTEKFKFDFPRPILDRLLASEIVPLQAKIDAIESWRRELAEAGLRDPRIHELDECLAGAERFLKGQPRTSRIADAAARVSSLVRSCLSRSGLSDQPPYPIRSESRVPGLPRSRVA